MGLSDWDSLRKQARHLENEIDLKLVAFNKAGSSGSGGYNLSSNDDTTPLLDKSVFDSLTIEIEQMLGRLLELNDKMAELPSTSTATMHTIKRHKDIYNSYKLEFNRIVMHYRSRIEYETDYYDLIKSNSSSGFAATHASTSALNDRGYRDGYLKESIHLNNSHNMVNDQINIAIETKENLLSQRHQFKRLQTRFNDLSNRFPLISSLMQRIQIRKRRDSIIIGFVAAVCTIILLLYAFH